MENSGRRSSIKRTRHINIRYYFITDRITKEDKFVEFFPNLDIIGDYFIKALQESQFFPFSNFVLGIHEYDIPSFNASKRALVEEQKIKPENKK